MNQGKSLYIICALLVCFIFPTKALELLYPRSGVFIAQNPISFSWQRSPSVVQLYKIQIAENPDFNNPIIDTTLSSSSSSIQMPQITGKTYYWRVFDKVLGASSAINSFTFVIPDSVGQLAAWFKPESGFTVASGKVSQWNDAVAANNMLQANNGLQPNYITQEPLINNNPAVQFLGNGATYMQATTTTSLTNFSIYCLRTWEENSVSLQYYLGGNARGLYSEAGFFGAGWGTFDGVNVFSTSPLDKKSPYSIYLHSNSKLKRNNNAPFLASPKLTNMAYNTLGARPDNLGAAYKGRLAEILVYSQELSDDNDVLLYNYFADKYAPPVNLGPDTILGISFCDSVTITAGNRFVSYLWSNNRTAPTIKVLPNGTYGVTVKDVFERFSSDDITVYPYRRLWNKTIYICSGQSYLIDLKTPPGFTALWNTGATSTTLNVSTAGQYTVKVTDGSGCFVMDTINVIIDNPRVSLPIVSGNMNACNGEKLFVLSETAFDSIRWSTGSTSNFIVLSTPGTYSITATTSIGCTINKSFNVTIIGNSPTAKFGLNPACQGAELNFFDSTLVPQGNTIQSWKWNFSNGTSSTLEDPVSSFPNLGLASAALKVTTNVGCTDSIFKTFIVNRRPTPSFFNLLSCEGNPTVFVDQTIPNSASVVDWLWDFGGLGSSNGIQNPAFVFPAQGVYKITLKATNSNGCSDTTSLYTSVNSSPTANFSFDSVCGKTPVNLKFLATVQPPSIIPDLNWGKWNFGDGSEENAIRNPQHVYDEPGTYEVSLIVKSSNQCVDTVVKQVKVFDFPVVDFTVSQTQCVGKEIQFSDISATPDGTPINKWNWFFSGQGSDTVQNPRYTFNAQGNYTIQLTARNEVGCSNTKLRSIAVSAPPQPKFTFSPQNGLPPLNVTYNNQSPTNGNYLWSYGDGSPIVAGYNPPAHVYTTIGTYPIKLVATDFRGCTDTLTKFILVDRAYLDGVMAAITIIPTTDDYYKIQVTIINNSNIEITALGLSIQLGGGSVVRENWSGSLLPGQTTVYVFTGELKTGDNAAPVVCASIDNVNNNAFENRTDNNTTCKELSVGSFDILTIFPNPASDNNINFGIMLPKEGNVNIRFVDILGQQMYTRDFDGTRGYNQLTMPISMLNAAVYVAEVSFDGQVIYKKFMKKNRK